MGLDTSYDNNYLKPAPLINTYMKGDRKIKSFSAIIKLHMIIIISRGKVPLFIWTKFYHMYLKYKRYHLAFWLYHLTISIERNNEDGGPP